MTQADRPSPYTVTYERCGQTAKLVLIMLHIMAAQKVDYREDVGSKSICTAGNYVLKTQRLWLTNKIFNSTAVRTPDLPRIREKRNSCTLN